jgi:NAD(P)-dependent dehydrogenase (short-subunit alcohol dehydrogenase family)
MTAKLAGKVCLVTGASRGIGAAIAHALASEGARLVVHYAHNEHKATAVATALPGSGHIVAGADLANPAVVEGFMNEVVDKTGRLDVLVNNAGIFLPHPPLEVDRNEWLLQWQQTIAVNLLSPAALSHAAALIMKEQGGGRIINVGSRGAFRGEPHCPAYAASKAGLHAMSQSLAVALAASGIQVYAVAPGFVETDMAKALLDSDVGAAIRSQSPLNRVARPEEVAEIVCFLATSDAEFLTGGIFDINGASYLRT